MNWKKELRVGDKFLYSDLSHYALVTDIDTRTISFTWYYLRDGTEAGSPVLNIDHFYGLKFAVPITPLLDSLL